MKKLVSLLTLLCIFATLLVSCGNEPEDNTIINIGVLSGPTGMGMAQLMSTEGVDARYNFEVRSNPTDAVSELANGDLDMLCLPTNTAANLGASKSDYISVLAINCLGSLYLMTDENTTVTSIADLEGKTIYASVPTSTTGPIINYILSENNVNATVEFEPDHDSLVAKVKKGEAPIVILPEPKATAAMKQNAGYSIDLNLSTEWDKISDEPLTMGCIVVRNEFLNAHKTVVERFLDEYKTSIEYIGNEANLDTAAQMIVDAGILPQLPVAKSALSNLYGSIVYIDGQDMKDALLGFYDAIVQAKLPEDEFYYGA